jgi:hypothetical protein
MSVKSFPVAPDSVRVWCGYKMHDMELKKFQDLLGQVFIPACVKLQTKIGLTSYIPTVLAGMSEKKDYVPDETALIFYESQDVYRDCFKTLAERVYALDHHGVFSFEKNDLDFKSYSDFPILFDGSLKIQKPVYLFDKQADWMHGKIRHFVGSRPPNMQFDEFQKIISKSLTKIQQSVKLDGAIACIDDNYLVYWELMQDDSSPSGISLLDGIFTDWKNIFTANPTSIPKDLWDEWPGLANVNSGSSLNMTFDRHSAKV